jgi:hypothetical protein
MYFLYPELNALLEEFGTIRTFNFFIYGEPSQEEIEIINRGLFFRIVHATEIIKERVVAIIENIGEEQANHLNCYRGTRMVLGIAQNDLDENVIQDTILEGLDYLRFKADYLGMKESVSDV